MYIFIYRSAGRPCDVELRQVPDINSRWESIYMVYMYVYIYMYICICMHICIDRRGARVALNRIKRLKTKGIQRTRVSIW